MQLYYFELRVPLHCRTGTVVRYRSTCRTQGFGKWAVAYLSFCISHIDSTGISIAGTGRIDRLPDPVLSTGTGRIGRSYVRRCGAGADFVRSGG